MHRSRQAFSIWGFSLIFCALITLSACGQSSGNGASSTLSPGATRTALPLSATPTSGPATIQSCPAQGTARSAVMPATREGSHPNIIYISQQESSSTLQRYDIITASTTTILRSKEGDTIQRANISSDRQWIILIASLQGQAAIQLVRIDGQEWQTLYCAPVQTSIDAALLSPDQHHLVFNQVNQDYSRSILYLLDIATGQLSTELSPQQPSYHEIVQEQQQSGLRSWSSSSVPYRQGISSYRAQELYPMPSKHYLTYIPIKWASNSSVYLFGTIQGGSGYFPHQLDLLRDISKDATEQQSNLQPITATIEGNACGHFDVTPDNQQLICGTQPSQGTAGPGAIQTQPISGGTLLHVYHGPEAGSIVPHALSNSTLIFLLEAPSVLPTLWEINTDGSRLTQLISAKTADTVFDFGDYSYLSWSTISSDGMLYALKVSSISTAAQSLIFGPLDGGATKTIVSNTQGLMLVGWSQF